MTENERESAREYMLFVLDELDQITRMQAEVINDLFKLLSQHIAADELDSLPVVGKINEAARIRAEIDKGICGETQHRGTGAFLL